MGYLETKYLYLAILFFSILGPLSYSFEKKIYYYQHWGALLKSVFFMMLLFIPWDIWFTKIGVWWFNERYLSGIIIWLLPLEEWLFFILIPFSCVFIYEIVNYYVKKDIFKKIAPVISVVTSVFLLSLAVLHSDKMYPLVTFSIASLFLLLTAYFKPFWMGKFLLMYLISMIPFLIVNGILTGGFTQEAVVNYHPKAFMGMRIGSIPLEDSVYSLAMLLMVVSIYERCKK